MAHQFNQSPFVVSADKAQSELENIAKRDKLEVSLIFDPEKGLWEARIQPIGRMTRMWARSPIVGDACAKVLMQYRAMRHAIVAANPDSMRTARRVGVPA